uniref:Beta-catenin-like protein 1 n=1 Tax=Lynceus sp. MCZ IZ 141354 TaxID=1930659 RepID=A0A9N6WSM4_9CRUS|nr:EOG090X03ST [Lynceus sp. MCZ IZ 141354]
MDVGELLSFKPKTIPKRDVSELGEDVGQTAHVVPEKRPRVQFNSKSDTAEAEKLPDLPEPEVEGLNELSLKKMVLNFEKKALKNQELRIKFPGCPEKFMESEVELHEAIQQIHALATVPELYPLAVSLNLVPSLLNLLSHENADIAIAVVNLLQELTDIDTLNESEEHAAPLIDALLEQQITALLIQNMERLDESVSEEADGVHYSLAIIENLTEAKPEICLQSVQQGLMAWLLKRIRVKGPFDPVKLYTSEILSIVLQNETENRKTLGDLDGIDILLQQLAVYKRNDPKTSEETEMVENLFDSLCLALHYAPNRDKFLKGEGLQLMNLMLREKKHSRTGALKVLNHALTGPEGRDNCQKFVDILGLRTIFPLFMKTPKKQKRKGLSAEEFEEHVLSIIASVLRGCKGVQLQRLLLKFSENDHEKVDRLMELHFKFLEKVRLMDEQLAKEYVDDEDAETVVYMKKLEGGLFSLQLVDLIIIDVCANGPDSVKQRVLHILNLRKASIKTIRDIMREYAGNLGDGDSEMRLEEQQRIMALVDKF